MLDTIDIITLVAYVIAVIVMFGMVVIVSNEKLFWRYVRWCNRKDKR